MKKRIVLLFTMLLAITCGAFSVKANTTYVGGGQFNYGVGFTGAYADYYHPTRVHTSEVHSPGGELMDRDRALPQTWAKSRIANWSGNCKFYWSVE